MRTNSIDFASYTAKTKKGNEYKKTYCSTLVIPLVLIGIPAIATQVATKKNNGVKQFLEKQCARFKISPKMIPAFFAASFAVKVLIGLFVDAKVNKKRAEAADKAAEAKSLAMQPDNKS